MWKNPSVVKHHVDMRVAPLSVTSLLQMLQDAGIPHHVIADDLHKFIFTSFFTERRDTKRDIFAIAICLSICPSFL